MLLFPECVARYMSNGIQPTYLYIVYMFIQPKAANIQSVWFYCVLSPLVQSVHVCLLSGDIINVYFEQTPLKSVNANDTMAQ